MFNAGQTPVLDEADLMLDMGFPADIQAHIRSCRAQRQKPALLVPFPDESSRLAKTLLRQSRSEIT